MKSRFGVILSVLLLMFFISACGSQSASNSQVEELQRQVAELQQQVGQNNNQTQVAQSVQTTGGVSQGQVSNQGQPAVNQQNQAMQKNQASGQGQVVGQQYGYQQNVNISLEQAKEIATKSAGFDVNSVTFVKSVQDYDDGFIKWDVDFVVGNNKYDYDIDAMSGNILKSEIEAIAYNQGAYVPPVIPQNAGINQGAVAGQGAAAGQGVDVETAKATAVNSVGLNVGSVTFTKQKYDFDDGIAKWELEFVAGTNKYEIEVNVASGMIVKSEIESIYND